MGIQINGNTDIISAIDGSLDINGLNSVNATGLSTFSGGIRVGATTSIVVGDSFIRNNAVGIGSTTTTGRNAGVGTATGTLVYNSTESTIQVYRGSVGWANVQVNTFLEERTFSYTGSPQSTTIPSATSEVVAYVYGAAGGTSPSAGAGGGGGYVLAPLKNLAGQTLTLVVGQGGVNDGPASPVYGGGGPSPGAGEGSHGGGYSGIFIGPITQANAVIIAGGGGGGGYYPPNPGGLGGQGGLSGGNGTGSPSASGGGGATQSAGGTAGTPAGTAGSALQGGTGGNANCGGGGGGYYGGGGGGTGAADGGGGGGSSYYNPTYVNIGSPGNSPLGTQAPNGLNSPGSGPSHDPTAAQSSGSNSAKYSAGIGAAPGSDGPGGAGGNGRIVLVLYT